MLLVGDTRGTCQDQGLRYKGIIIPILQKTQISHLGTDCPEITGKHLMHLLIWHLEGLLGLQETHVNLKNITCKFFLTAPCLKSSPDHEFFYFCLNALFCAPLSIVSSIPAWRRGDFKRSS